MSLQVIGAGFGRTGTMSLKVALERLGFGPCERMSNLPADPRRLAAWHETLRRRQVGEAIDWNALFRGYRASVDWPGTYFWRELIAAYPDAKVLLTVRDPERWYESASATILRPGRAASSPPAVPGAAAGAHLMGPFVRELLFEGTFDGRSADRDYAIEVYNRHNAEVWATVPPQRLLVLEITEGWAPLCAFLGVPVPADEPFPRLNDAASIRARIDGAVPPALTPEKGS